MAALQERSISSVVRDIGGNVDRIARAELRLVVAGMRLQLDTLFETSTLLVSAAVAASAAGLFLLLGGMFALTALMPLWLAALVIALIPGLAAAALWLRYREETARDLPLESRDFFTVPGSDA